jgi:ATP-dependent Clp protease ATP-binding subunit ClpA
VTCSKCRFTYLSIPQEKLLLGASLFMGHQQQQQRTGQPPHPPTATAAAATAAAAAAMAAQGVALPAAAAAAATAAAAAAAAVTTGQAQRAVVDAGDVLAVVAEASGIPAEHISQSDWQPLAALEQRLRARVAGQEAAVAAAAGAVRLGRLGLQRGKRPLASLLLTGPAGVGKSTLCLAMAESLFGSDRHLLRFNMAEYADRASGTWHGQKKNCLCTSTCLPCLNVLLPLPLCC